MDSSSIDKNAKIIWDYMHMHHELEKSDAILALGSPDKRPAHYASKLFLEGYGKHLIFSGNTGGRGIIKGDKPEAEIYKDIAIAEGVNEKDIIVENESNNTGENIIFTRKLLEQMGIEVKSIILVQKPYVERRMFATVKKRWPEVEVTVVSEPTTYEEYFDKSPYDSKDELINQMVGDFHRMIVYPALGYQIEQEIPNEAKEAFENLVKMGFDRNIVK